MANRTTLEGGRSRRARVHAPILDAVSDYAIILLDRTGRVVSWNAGAERVTGYWREEIVGRHFACLYPAEDVASGKPQRELAAAAAEGRFEDEGWRVRKDGSRFWGNTVITAIRNEAGSLRSYVKVTRDMTEPKRAQRHLGAVLEVTQAILQGRESEDVLRFVAQQARELVGAAVGAVAVSEPGARTLVLRVADGMNAQELVGMRIPAEASLSAAVLRPKGSMVVGGASGDPRVNQPRAEFGNFGPVLLVPLRVRDRSAGAMIVGNPMGAEPFSDDDLTVVQTFAAQAAVSIEYARLRERL